MEKLVDYPDCCQNTSPSYGQNVGYHQYNREERNRFSRVKSYLPKVNTLLPKLSDEMRRTMWLRKETFMAYLPFRILGDDSHYNLYKVQSNTPLGDQMEQKGLKAQNQLQQQNPGTESSKTTAWSRRLDYLLDRSMEKSPLVFSIHEYLRVCRTIFPECCPVVEPKRPQLLFRGKQATQIIFL